MPRNKGSVVVNTLSKGLITEATGLNFPEGAVTEADNVVFNRVGSVSRRKGFDTEENADTAPYTPEDGVLREFLWSAVTAGGGLSFLVVQMGSLLRFYSFGVSGNVSLGLFDQTINLENYLTGGGDDVKNTPATFASGGGYLFVAHPFCDPLIVKWEEEEDTFYVSPVYPLVRDFEGLVTEDSPDINPTVLTTDHHYNLRNQGWHSEVLVGEVDNEVEGGGSLGGTSHSPELDWTAL